jgi:hypothetical protein
VSAGLYFFFYTLLVCIDVSSVFSCTTNREPRKRKKQIEQIEYPFPDEFDIEQWKEMPARERKLLDNDALKKRIDDIEAYRVRLDRAAEQFESTDAYYYFVERCENESDILIELLKKRHR